MNIEIKRLTPELTLRILLKKMKTDVIVSVGQALAVIPMNALPPKKDGQSLLNISKIIFYRGILHIAITRLLVGWCNANTKSDCYDSISWRRLR